MENRSQKRVIVKRTHHVSFRMYLVKSQRGFLKYEIQTYMGESTCILCARDCGLCTELLIRYLMSIKAKCSIIFQYLISAPCDNGDVIDSCVPFAPLVCTACMYCVLYVHLSNTYIHDDMHLLSKLLLISIYN